MNFNQFQTNCYSDSEIQSQWWVSPCGWSALNALDGPLIDLNALAGQFWLWGDSFGEKSSKLSLSQQNSLYATYLIQEIMWYPIELKFEGVRTNYHDYHVQKSLRKTSLPNVDKNLIHILSLINFGREVSFRPWTKSARGLFHGVSTRRSRYIGVLRNRSKWQVLLNEGKVKKYIGTYPTEKEAAIVNDFYSIGINGLEAKTNFSYNKSQVKAMIMSYYGNKRKFDPSIFISEVY